MLKCPINISRNPNKLTWEAVCSNKFKMSRMSSKDVQDSNLHSFHFKDELVDELLRPWNIHFKMFYLQY